MWFYRGVLRLFSYVLCFCQDVMWLLFYVVWYLCYVVCSFCDVLSSLCFVDFTFGYTQALLVTGN